MFIYDNTIMHTQKAIEYLESRILAAHEKTQNAKHKALTLSYYQEQEMKAMVNDLKRVLKRAGKRQEDENNNAHKFRNNEIINPVKFAIVYKDLPKDSVWDYEYISKALGITKQQAYGLRQCKKIAPIFDRDKRAAKRKGLGTRKFLKAV